MNRGWRMRRKSTEEERTWTRRERTLSIKMSTATTRQGTTMKTTTKTTEMKKSWNNTLTLAKAMVRKESRGRVSKSLTMITTMGIPAMTTKQRRVNERTSWSPNEIEPRGRRAGARGWKNLKRSFRSGPEVSGFHATFELRLRSRPFFYPVFRGLSDSRIGRGDGNGRG